MLFKGNKYVIREKSLKARIYESDYAANYQVEEYQWNIKCFGNIYLK